MLYIKHLRQCFIRISKHSDESWKCDMQWSIFDKIWCVRMTKTPCWVFDISSKSNKKLRSKQRSKISFVLTWWVINEFEMIAFLIRIVVQDFQYLIQISDTQTLLNYSRYAGKDFCVWYDSLRPTHPTIHEEISKVLFHTAKFSYKSMCNLEAKSLFSIYFWLFFLLKRCCQVYILIMLFCSMHLKFIIEAPLCLLL